MTNRAIGDVRPSQVITTFGPGAIVDLQTLSVIVAGIDRWPIDERDVIHEPRLERALRVSRFFPAKTTDGSTFGRHGTVPAYLFPRYQVCPVCRTLSTVDEPDVEYDARWQELICKVPGCPGRAKRRATTLPAPFIVACPSGHIDDFPWQDYVHRGPTTCRKRLRLYSIATTGSVADIVIGCACDKSRSASDAFGERRADALGVCRRKRPWLGASNKDSAACPHSNEMRAMQRGATNSWFSVVRSALAVRESATPIGVAIKACNPTQISKIDSLAKLISLVEMEMFPSLTPFPPEAVWHAIRRSRGEIEVDEIDLRWPEWTAFRDPPSSLGESSELFLQEGEVPEAFGASIARVVLARKLLEVRALVGFTRVDTVGVAIDDGARIDVAPIYRNRTDWLPAIEVRGEGVFIELREDSVRSWESNPEVQARAKAMEETFRRWEEERGTHVTPFPGSRYLLLHTLAHCLIRQLSLDCGYSASSVRERIYSSGDQKRGMAGVLLYTASSDSEGSLGGLVDLGAPNRLPELLTNSLRSAARCSSDPLCADHRPEVHGTINAAACHACVLVSETSCEGFNRFLDRNALVSTIASRSVGFFPDMMS